MQSHTPEPWTFYRAFPHYPSRRAEVHGQNRILFHVPSGNNPKERAEFLANARRLIACVNACEGIATVLLEDLSTGKMSGAILDPEAAHRLAVLNKACDGIPTDFLEKLPPGALAEIIEQIIQRGA